jgi:hypothetical protein
MSEKVTQYPYGDDEEDSIFVNGALLDLESVESAIDALAREEAVQGGPAPDRLSVRSG